MSKIVNRGGGFVGTVDSGALPDPYVPADGTMNITGALAVSGVSTFADGAADLSAPGIAFTSDTDTGITLVGGNVYFGIGGVEAFHYGGIFVFAKDAWPVSDGNITLGATDYNYKKIWVQEVANSGGAVKVSTAANFESTVQAINSGDSLGNLWHEEHVSPTDVSPGASGATLTVGGGTNDAAVYYLLDAVNEYLYWGTDVEEYWDAGSDLVVEVLVALDGAETANDYIRATIDFEYCAEHENMDSPKEQSVEVDHDIGAFNSAGDVHKLTFVMDHDLASNVLQAEDIVKFRFYLDDVSSGATVAAVRFLYANIKYRQKELYAFDSMPVSG